MESAHCHARGGSAASVASQMQHLLILGDRQAAGPAAQGGLDVEQKRITVNLIQRQMEEREWGGYKHAKKSWVTIHTMHNNKQEGSTRKEEMRSGGCRQSEARISSQVQATQYLESPFLPVDVPEGCQMAAV